MVRILSDLHMQLRTQNMDVGRNFSREHFRSQYFIPADYVNIDVASLSKAHETGGIYENAFYLQYGIEYFSAGRELN